MNLTKQKHLRHNIRKYLREYNEVTGIHGLRYLTEKRTTAEKIFWAIILLVSLGGCIYMIYEIVNKYENSPVVVSFATKDTPIYEIPFPAVTICPETKCAREMFNYSAVYKRVAENKTLGREEAKIFSYMTLLCEPNGRATIGNFSETVRDDFFSTIDALKPDYVLFLCNFMGTVYPCEKIFVPVITEEGICYSFNLMDRAELFREHVHHYGNFFQVKENSRNFDPESGYAKNAGLDTYPRRALMSGPQNALEIILLHQHINTDFLCNGYLQGYKVIIHHPLDTPFQFSDFFLVPLDKTITATIQPELVTTSDAVKSFRPEKRNCYLRTERPLKHFKEYTQSNCMLECLANHTFYKCGCVDFFMPRDKSSPICGGGNADCLKEARREVTLNELESKIFGEDRDCDCIPLCTDLKYNVETSNSDFFWSNYYAAVAEVTNKSLGLDPRIYDSISMSALSLYFKAEQFIMLERNELYGISDLISNFGGLLGLFTGFSLISLAEIIYFLSLRLFCNVRLYGFWSGPPD